MKQEELVKIAKEYKANNPRCFEYSLDMVHYGVKSQFGKLLTPEETKDFLLYLTGHDFTIEYVKEKLENTPKWLKKMYDR